MKNETVLPMKRLMLTAMTAILVAAVPNFILAAGEESTAPEAADLVRGNNTLALELYQTVAAEEDGNVFISPWSISTALGMTWAGARGATADEMAEVLRFPANQATTHALFGELHDALNGIQEAGYLTLRTANAIWPSDREIILPEFAAIINEHYDAHAEVLDYVADTEGSRQRINGWVAERTEDRIPELLMEGVLGRDTAIVLTNAIYFKGAWKTLFDPEDTEDSLFYPSIGEPIEIPMMQMREDLSYYEDEDLRLVTLPYHGEQVEAVLISPKDGNIAALEQALTLDKLEGWLGQRTEEEDVRVRLPRFTLRYKKDLVDGFRQMGMNLPFTGAADFSGIFGRKNLAISKIIHETFLQVKEEGTEAAGATAVVIEFTSFVPKPEFNGNRPFLFLIRDNATGSLLFMGRVERPEPIEDDEPTGVDPETIRSCFGEDASLNDGWWETSGFGRFRAEEWPWIEHDALGWIYVDVPTAQSGRGYWLYDFRLGWLYTTKNLYPNFWNQEEGWLLYITGGAGIRWFYRHGDGAWLPK